jgi:hypothetical protein
MLVDISGKYHKAIPRCDLSDDLSGIQQFKFMAYIFYLPHANIRSIGRPNYLFLR